VTQDGDKRIARHATRNELCRFGWNPRHGSIGTPYYFRRPPETECKERDGGKWRGHRGAGEQGQRTGGQGRGGGRGEKLGEANDAELCEPPQELNVLHERVLLVRRPRLRVLDATAVDAYTEPPV